MNKFDDFLKSKMGDASFDVPSNWETLNTALPGQSTGKGFVKWAFALLLVGSMVTTALVLNKYNTHVVKIAGNTKISQTSPERKIEITSPSTTLTGVTESIAESAIQKAPVTVRKNYAEIHGNTTTPVIDVQAAAPPITVNTTIAKQILENNQVVLTKEEVIAPDKTTENSLMNKKEEISKPRDAQKTTTRKTPQRSDFHKGKFYACVSFSPMLSYRSFQLSNGAAPFVNKQYDDIRQNSEAKIISYGTSLSLEYKFSKNFSLQGGISYNKIGFKSQYEFDVTDKATTDNTGRIIGYENLPNTYTTTLNSKTKIDVLRIPFGINYNLFMNSNSLFHFYFGGAHSVLLSASGVRVNSLTLEQTPVSKNDFINNAKEVCVALGVNIALTPKYAFGVDLYYNKWLTNISKSKLENVTPFTAGLNLSISRKIF